MEATRGRSAGSRAGYNTWMKSGLRPGIVEAALGYCADSRLKHLEGSVGDDQVLWKLPGVVVQVAGLVTTPGGS